MLVYESEHAGRKRLMSSIKEALRKDFAKAAEDFIAKLQRVEQAIGALRGPLPVCLDMETLLTGRIKSKLCSVYKARSLPFARDWIPILPRSIRLV